ncbi:UbiA family prenyltransferase [Hymenobacter sp. BT635]|uniref:UbiA family prenyltransferase n=1 Tax=Hymenobacter nitidus TaxID=2880929 RepID=A0ABS8ACZ8_9BACT|nr:UbiA family prenyltransferase [Hymenobacter nitidus]MCB2377812.1 UbiA family prenyltransferase [Hymenobacter nitidus]
MSRVQAAPLQGFSGQLAEIARVQDWWSCKFSPVLATFYASACLTGLPVWPLLPQLLLLLLGLTVGATYVSVINDWTDQADDHAGGKYNRLANKSRAFPTILLLLCLGTGLVLGIYFWRCSPLSGLLYLGSWVAFSCYSLPPIRLKKRGLAGVLSDAAGSHFFPQLLTVSLVAAWTDQTLPTLWYAAVGVWALACGLRNILLHQLDDVEADAQAGVTTWVTLRGARFAQRFGQFVVFPVEVLAFGSMLVISQQLWPVLLLLVYAGLEVFKWRLWSSPPMVLQPNSRIMLGEYYEVFYPLAFVLALSARHPIDGWVLALHLLLFGLRFWQTLRLVGWAGSLVVRKILSRVG